jgi:F-type H+-transporting ATPase subunit epsilon
MLIARATDGDIGILPGHVPLIAGLDIWPLRILNDDGEIKIAVCGGFLEVRPNKITILANAAELHSEIDVDRALLAKEKAENNIKSGAQEGVDFDLAQLALKKAIMRLKTAGRI